jgi:hypothetical protein
MNPVNTPCAATVSGREAAMVAMAAASGLAQKAGVATPLWTFHIKQDN